MTASTTDQKIAAAVRELLAVAFSHAAGVVESRQAEAESTVAQLEETSPKRRGDKPEHAE
jgi:hypothetical protein